MNDFSGKRVTVAGLGHFGGNIAVCRWLVAQGAQVLATDVAPTEKLADAIAQLEGLPITYHLGGHDEHDFADADIVIASPAIPPGNRYLNAATAAGVPVTTEICLFTERCPSRNVVGITGTKGKSTTTAMLGAILKSSFDRVWVGGNIGRSMLLDLPTIQPGDPVVLELSSFMLHYLRKQKWSPRVGVLTMLAADHLDWHGSRDAYIADKGALFEQMSPDSLAIIPHQPEAEKLAQTGRARIVHFGNHPQPIEVPLPGRHNRLNAEAAVVAAEALGVSRAVSQAALRAFRGLPHRLELVHESNGIRYFNDSIATIPDATIAAMNAFASGTVLMIIGGSDKGLDVAPMCRALADRAKAVFTVGATGPSLAERIGQLNPARHAINSVTVENAVKAARAHASPGDVILLSPGFASYDQFTNFQHRGEAFAKVAREEV